MNVMVAVGAFNALFLAVLVQGVRRKAFSNSLETKTNPVMADQILSVFLFLTSVVFALVFASLEYGRDGLLLILVFSNFLLSPIFYLYVRALVNPAKKLFPGSLLIFCPWVLANLYLLALLDSLDPDQITWLFQDAGINRRPFIYNILYLMDLASVPLFLGLSWKALQRHKSNIDKHYSDHRGIDYRWLKWLIWAVMASWFVIELLLQISQAFEFISESWSLVLGFSFASLMVFYLGYHGIRQSYVYWDAQEGDDVLKKESENRYSKSGLSEKEAAIYKDRLLKIMHEKEPFLANNLTIRELAGQVGLTEHNISEVINVGVGMSFFDFINSYRVAEFKSRAVLPDNQKATLLSLALECGFSSKSSFNRIFKKNTGLTPSQFLKSFEAYKD